MAKAQRAAFDLIEQAPRRRDNNICSLTQELVLPSISGAAKQHHGAQIGKPRVIADSRLDLRRELPRRFEHERAQSAPLPKAGNDRQCKRRSLSRAGLRRTDDISALQDKRNSAQLNWGRIGIARGANAIDDFR